MVTTESEFLRDYDPAKFERPSLTVDLVLMTVADGALRALAVRRDTHPEKGKWALPGSFVGADESLDAAAKRVLKEKAHIASAYLEQLYTFGDVHRDPRTRIVTVVYFALLPETHFEKLRTETADRVLAKIETDGSTGRVKLHDAKGAVLKIAFDHADILTLAVKRLRGKLDYSDIAFALLPAEFTLRQLQKVHEAILGTSLNKPAFRRRLLDKKILKATGRYESGAAFRPAELYTFVPQKMHSH
jgi:8-oxo-dGTP diphosphatase